MFLNLSNNIDIFVFQILFEVSFSKLNIHTTHLVIIFHCFAWTHWGRVTHICVGNLTIISPDNGLSPGRRQAII